MLDEKLYTVADVAKVTGMTSRTIRNYLKDGTLTGQKIGVQWRFTEDEVRKLFSRQQPGQSTPTQIVRGFLGVQEREQRTSCVLLDVPALSDDEGLAFYRRLQELRPEGIDALSYEYHDGERLLRVAVSGRTDATLELMQKLQQADG